MTRRGGYSRSANHTSIRVASQIYAEAIRSADDMDQDVIVWLSDAIAHHAYRCELILIAEQYRRDCATSEISPQKWEARYQPKRAKPTITMRAGQGTRPHDREA